MAGRPRTIRVANRDSLLRIFLQRHQEAQLQSVKAADRTPAQVSVNLLRTFWHGVLEITAQNEGAAITQHCGDALRHGTEFERIRQTVERTIACRDVA